MQPMSAAYDAVKSIAATQRPEYVQAIRDCHDYTLKQRASGSIEYFDAKWLHKLGQPRYPSLKRLAGWGLLQRHRFGTTADGQDLDASGRVFYVMPDLESVNRALVELGA